MIFSEVVKNSLFNGGMLGFVFFVIVEMNLEFVSK